MNIYTKNSFFKNKEINLLLKNNESYFDFIFSDLEELFDKIDVKNTIHCKEFDTCIQLLENKIYTNPDAEVTLNYHNHIFAITIWNNDSQSSLKIEFNNQKKKIDKVDFKFKYAKKDNNEFGERKIFNIIIDNNFSEIMFFNTKNEQIYINFFYTTDDQTSDILTLSNNTNDKVPEMKYKNHDMVKEIREYIFYANNLNSINDLLDIEKITTDNQNPLVSDMLTYFNYEKCLDVIIKNEFSTKKKLNKKLKIESV